MRQINDTSLKGLLHSFLRHRSLIVMMIKQDILSRYRWYLLGSVWSIIQPLTLLALYTFVFKYVFQAKWGVEADNAYAVYPYALVLFLGLIVHGLLAEIMNRSPHIIAGSPNYVKKIVFPLEIFSWVILGVAFYQACINLSLLFLALLFVGHFSLLSLLYTLCIFMVFVPFLLGVGWILSAVCIYIRDVGQIMGLCLTVLLFASPIFCPLSAFPASVRWVILLNPLTLIVEELRQAIFLGGFPDVASLGLYFIFSLGVGWLGFIFFQAMRRGFADVL